MIGNLLSIQQTYGQIGLNIQPAQLSIQQPKADLQMDQYLGEVEIEKTPLEIHIDQQQCRNEIGIKDLRTLTADLTQEAREKVIEAIGLIAEAGTRIMRIEDGGNPIVEMAQEIGNPPPVDFNVDTIPKSRPIIEFTGGELHFNVQPARTNIQVTPRKPIIEATLPKVQGYMKQWPAVKIEYLGHNLDTRW